MTATPVSNRQTMLVSMMISISFTLIGCFLTISIISILAGNDFRDFKELGADLQTGLAHRPQIDLNFHPAVLDDKADHPALTREAGNVAYGQYIRARQLLEYCGELLLCRLADEEQMA